jgi:hypothetical protein
MRIAITGRGVKSVVVYPLLLCLNELGGALVLTDDSAYRRLLPSAESRVGTIKYTDVRICADAMITEDEMARLDVDPDEYQNVVFDLLTSGLAQHGAEILVQCDTDPVTKIAEPNRHVIRVGYTPPKERDVHFIELTTQLCREIYEMECRGRLEPLKAYRSGRFRRAVAPMFSKILGLSEKEVAALLTGKGGFGS